jgi:hypothetical protein
MGFGYGANNPTLYKRTLLRSLQEIQPDFEEEAKAYALLWSQGKKKKKKFVCNLYSSSNIVRTIE